MQVKPLAGAGSWIALVAIVLAMPVAKAPGQSAPASAAPPDPSRLVNQYCAGCHNQKLKSGGVSLAGLDFTNTAANSETLEKVLRKVRSGEMPPAGLPRPNAATSAAFTDWLQTELDQFA